MSRELVVVVVVYSGQCTWLHLASSTGMQRKLKETNISTKHNTCRLKNPTWREADQLAIYKHDRGVELGSTEKQLQLNGQSGT